MVQPLPVITLILLFVLAGILPLATIPSGIIKTPQVFSLGWLPTNQYMENACPCYIPDPPDFATNEREISNQYFAQNESIPDERGLGGFTWAWGQLLAHELANSVLAPSPSYTVAIDETRNITLFRTEGRILDNGCKEPISTASPELDASVVYGSYLQPERIQVLRPTGDCKLLMGDYNLPPIINGSYYCGDNRCGENPALLTLHTLLAREHNYWCDRIVEGGTEEEKFWKARAIVSSIFQHITYQHWLPALMGSQYNLLGNSNPQVVGSGIRITNEFDLVVLRFGHSMIPEFIGPYHLRNMFFNNTFLPTEGIPAFALALAKTPAEKIDTKVVDTLRNFLFSLTMGEDLVTRNLFRGRELYESTYAQLTSCFGVEPYPESLQYRDTFLALLSEPLVSGSSLPRTMAVVIAEQFERLRRFDPLFYTRRVYELSHYMDAIKSTTISTLLHRHTSIGNALPISADLFYTQ